MGFLNQDQVQQVLNVKFSYLHIFPDLEVKNEVMMTRVNTWQFHNDGYLVVENFLSDEDVASLKSAIATIIDDFDPSEHRSVFTTTDTPKQVNLWWYSILKTLSLFNWRDDVRDNTHTITCTGPWCLLYGKRWQNSVLFRGRSPWWKWWFGCWQTPVPKQNWTRKSRHLSSF